MVRTPARSAAMMPGLPWQCAATARSASPATSTMARSSAPVNCWWIGSSTSDLTPPAAPERLADRPHALGGPVGQPELAVVAAQVGHPVQRVAVQVAVAAGGAQ